jgi:uncharacterized protein YjbI with pentapeptide repeats
VIVTFYSYKGGVGRSMALVNVGEMLADVGYDVIACDFDLEAPGLERYIVDDRAAALAYRRNLGVVDLLTEYKDVMAGDDWPSGKASDDWREVNGVQLRRPSSCAVPVPSPNTGRLGRLRFLGAGRRDGQWAQRYSESVQRFDWSDFYARWAGAAYIDFFRADLTEGQTVVLVDSRTGITEQGGVCTHHLADLVILMSAPNDINIDGTRWMSGILSNLDVDALRAGRPLQAMPVPARVETASQVAELEQFRTRFEREFAARVPAAVGDGVTFLQAAEIPYIPYFAFTEKVVARQGGASHRELHRAYEVLARAIVTVGLDAGLLTAPKRRDWLDTGTERAGRALEALLDRHRQWLATDGGTGARAVLRGRDLSRQDLSRVDLRRADLTEVNLAQADLRDVDLGGADLGRAVLRGAKLDRAKLPGANLAGADLTQVLLPGADLDYCTLDDANLEGAIMTGATLRGATLRRATLRRADLTNCDLQAADLAGAVLVGTDLQGANLRDATGLPADLRAGSVPAGPVATGSKGRGGRAGDRSPQAGTGGIVPIPVQREFPAMAEDFRFLDRRLVPSYHRLSTQADSARRAHRVLRWAVVGATSAIPAVAVLASAAGGSILTSAAGGPITSLVGASIIGAAVMVVAVALPATSRYEVITTDARRAARLLLAEYWRYLGRIGQYGEADREELLDRRVSAILAGTELR